jgi:DNA polymerase-3 subunit delta'
VNSREHRELPDWLQSHAARLDAMLRRQQLPQALLIHGIAGTGRHLLSGWLAGRLLGVERHRLMADGLDNAGVRGHPDFLWVAPPLEKNAISIEQIREDLIGFLQLKSHQGGIRVAVVAEAELMTVPAANSLLKTLEEPPADSIIILVASRLSRLPPTVVSRCHRLRISTPPRDLAIVWLNAQAPAAIWDELLDCAGGAPLLALSLQQAGFASHAACYEQELNAIRNGRASPVAVARRWAGGDLDRALRWLYWRVGRVIRDLSAADAGAQRLKVLQNPPKVSKISTLFGHLRAIEELRRDRAGGLNMELQLSALLTAWCVDPIHSGSRK